MSSTSSKNKIDRSEKLTKDKLTQFWTPWLLFAVIILALKAEGDCMKTMRSASLQMFCGLQYQTCTV